MYRSDVRRLPREPRRSPGFAALLSAVLPGLGQLYGSRRRRGLLMLAIPLLGLTLLAIVALFVGPVASAVVRRAALVTLLILGALYAFHIVVVADAFAMRSQSRIEGRHAIDFALLVAIVLGLSLGYLSIYRHSQAWANVLAAVFEPTPGRTLGAGTSTSDASAPGWSGRERLNVLLLGIDTRDDDPETLNSDTVIVLSIDPAGKTAAMLSIPRDTLVDIPGVGKDKVNSAIAHAGGEPAKGAELARKTVERFLDIPVHSYAIIDFDAFRATIDSVGGVLVDARRPLRDEEYPTAGAGIARIEFRSGPQVMDGENALEFARSRHDSNDFSRARRQQQVIFGLRQRIGQLGLFRVPSVMERVGPLVRTNFAPGNVLPLARTVLSIDPGEIRSDVLLPCGGDAPHCELTEDNSPGGYYLIPDAPKVRAFVKDLFAGAPAAAR